MPAPALSPHCTIICAHDPTLLPATALPSLLQLPRNIGARLPYGDGGNYTEKLHWHQAGPVALPCSSSGRAGGVTWRHVQMEKLTAGKYETVFGGERVLRCFF